MYCADMGVDNELAPHCIHFYVLIVCVLQFCQLLEVLLFGELTGAFLGIPVKRVAYVKSQVSALHRACIHFLGCHFALRHD